jgi:serine/threonine protein kinase
MMRCPLPEQLRDWLTDRLTSAEAEAIDTHVQTCAACQQTLEQLTRETDSAQDGSPAPGTNSGADFLRRLEQAVPSGPVPRPPTPESPSALIGPYKLLEQIGEGGMGTVWRAQQTEPVKRQVAVKLIKAGMDSRQVIARFEAERQALALMDHANIARVLDGGTTIAGTPWSPALAPSSAPWST